MLSVTYAAFHIQTPYAECCYAQYRYAECHYAECRYAECHYAECRYVVILSVVVPLLTIWLKGTTLA
jgi:hypothetical protein